MIVKNKLVFQFKLCQKYDKSSFKESDRYFASLECESEGDELEVGFKGGKSGCRTRSLSSDFKQYLANQGLQVPSDTSSLEVRWKS